jgi:hypothetical protein
VRGIRRRPLKHANERERPGGEDTPAERHGSVPGVAPCAPQTALQARPEEDEQERDERSEQESRDLVLTAVVSPVRVVLGRCCLAARITPGEGESNDEDEPYEYTRKRQETSEAVGCH